MWSSTAAPKEPPLHYSSQSPELPNNLPAVRVHFIDFKLEVPMLKDLLFSVRLLAAPKRLAARLWTEARERQAR